MIWRCLEDRTYCVTTPKDLLISCDASASVLTQPTPGSADRFAPIRAIYYLPLH